MNIHFTLLIIVLSWLAAALFLLFLGGILVRAGLHRAPASAGGVTRLRSLILGHLRVLQ